MADIATARAVTLAPRRRFPVLRKLARHGSFRIGFIVMLLLVGAAAADGVRTLPRRGAEAAPPATRCARAICMTKPDA
jgi:hypothetical protein